MEVDLDPYYNPSLVSLLHTTFQSGELLSESRLVGWWYDTLPNAPTQAMACHGIRAERRRVGYKLIMQICHFSAYVFSCFLHSKPPFPPTVGSDENAIVFTIQWNQSFTGQTL